MQRRVVEAQAAPVNAEAVKCVVWDLDNTLWDGVLLEGDPVHVTDEVASAVRDLDKLGVLQSVASKNEARGAIAELSRWGLLEYFLHPQIGWSAKSQSLRRIASELNIGLDSFILVDDQPFERDEVKSAWPEVQVIRPSDMSALLDKLRDARGVVTEESGARRVMYQQEARRREDEERYDGAPVEFLAELDMIAQIFSAGKSDLARAEELTVRTHQLNTTGRTYTREELSRLSEQVDHDVLLMRLTDRYGSYGNVGMVVVEKTESVWYLRLLLMSCRVMGRGAGSAFLSEVLKRGREAGVTIHADFVPNDRNRLMFTTLRFAGFEVPEMGVGTHLVHRLESSPEPPPYIRIQWIGATECEG